MALPTLGSEKPYDKTPNEWRELGFRSMKDH
jgi:hypothetical protein